MSLKRVVPLFFLLVLTLPHWALAEPPPPTEPAKEGSKSVSPPNVNSPSNAPIPSDGWADGTGGEPTPPTPYVGHVRSQIFAFQLNGLFLLQAGGGNSFTGQFSWTPQFKIDRYEMRFDFGLSVPKNSLGDLFLSVNYELMFRTRINPETRLDIGGGAQTWTGARGITHPIASAQLSRFYDIKSPVNQIFLGYSIFFAANTIHLFKAGIGFTL